MATLLFAWELGGGLGHLMQIRPLAEDLAKAGHTVYVALRQLDAATAALGHVGVKFMSGPAWLSKASAFPSPVNYAQLLANVGFNGDPALFARACAWRNLLSLVRPNLLICDHAPTALLASRGFPLRRALLGSGFCCPPDEADAARWGLLRPVRLATTDAAELRSQADRILACVNRLLAHWKQPSLDRLGRLYSDVQENFLTTFAELDHFPHRASAKYWGPVLNEDAGEAPNWPAGEGRRVFAYLKPGPTARAAVAALRATGHPTLVHVAGIDPGTRKKYESPTLRFEPRPLDMKRVSRECDLAVLHAGHGATAEMLLAGKPILQLPLNLEQRMMAGATVRLGAGEMAKSLELDQLAGKLKALLIEDRHRQAAERFRAAHADFDPARQRQAIFRRAMELAG